MLFFARLSTTVALLAVAAMVLFSVSGCASQEHRDQLAAMQRDCAAGFAWGCDNAKAQAEANHQEAMDNAGNVALIAVLLPLAVLVAVLGEDPMPDDDDPRHVHHVAHWHR